MNYVCRIRRPKGCAWTALCQACLHWGHTARSVDLRRVPIHSSELALLAPRFVKRKPIALTWWDRNSIGSAFPRLSARLPTLLLPQRVRDHPESVAPRSCTSSGRRSKRSGSCHGHSRLLTRCTAQCDAPRDRSADILENLRGPTGVPFGPDRPCEVRGPEGQLRDGGRPHREFKIHSNRLTVHPKNAPHCVQLEWIGARLLGIGCQPQPMPKTHASAGHRD